MNFKKLSFPQFVILVPENIELLDGKPPVESRKFVVEEVHVDGRNFELIGTMDEKYDADLSGISKVDINTPSDLKPENWEEWLINFSHIEIDAIFDELDALEKRKNELEERLQEIRRESLVDSIITVKETPFRISFQKQVKKNKDGTKNIYNALVATGTYKGRYRKIQLGKKVLTSLDAQKRIEDYLSDK